MINPIPQTPAHFEEIMGNPDKYPKLAESIRLFRLYQRVRIQIEKNNEQNLIKKGVIFV